MSSFMDIWVFLLQTILGGTKLKIKWEFCHFITLVLKSYLLMKNLASCVIGNFGSFILVGSYSLNWVYKWKINKKNGIQVLKELRMS